MEYCYNQNTINIEVRQQSSLQRCLQVATISEADHKCANSSDSDQVFSMRYPNEMRCLCMCLRMMLGRREAE